MPCEHEAAERLEDAMVASDDYGALEAAQVAMSGVVMAHEHVEGSTRQTRLADPRGGAAL